jgi:hypothetical protein
MWLCTRQSNLGSNSDSAESVAWAKLQRYLIYLPQTSSGTSPRLGQVMPLH